ncbi:MAG: hypothetical protein NW200_13430 [Hyphomonadaceae bacterium]|nr:hypothetical protein [Hyphomonadaceae bacterium]
MRRPFFQRLFPILLVAGLLAACGTAPAAPMRRENLTRQIADDAAAFNEAYARTVSGQILLNILRARDRQPRYYLSMSGIADAPSLRFRENVGVSGTPLGEGGSPWGFGSFGFERETSSRPSYAVQPLSAETLTKTVFQPTPTNVFGHYWQSGWSRDLLILLMVERIVRVEVVGGERVVTEVLNDATNIRTDCLADEGGGCKFVRAARAFLGEIAVRDEAPATSDATPVCGLVTAYAPAQPVRQASPPPGQTCEPRFVVGAATYVMSLRSFDDIVYYVGELMRPSLTQAGDGAVMASPLTVRAAGLRSDTGAPLFRILPAEAARQAAPTDPQAYFAAGVAYGGRRFYAGPPVGRSCPAATPDGLCADDPVLGDRSSSVLSLLAELLALNQSPDAIRAPQRLFVE